MKIIIVWNCYQQRIEFIESNNRNAPGEYIIQRWIKIIVKKLPQKVKRVYQKLFQLY